MNINEKLSVPLSDDEREQFEALKKMFYHIIPEKAPNTYFICGEGGSKDDNNLPEFVFICPAYGVEYSVVYKKVKSDE